MSVSFEAPYDPLPPIGSGTAKLIEEAALGANDRYLVDVIEHYAFCPYAKEGRAAGETSRFVHYADSSSVEPLLALMEKARRSGVVVTQVILPMIEIEADAFIRFCTQLTELGHEVFGEKVFAIAPLHPGLSFGENPHAMVQLFRRAPDPTIQWVRLDGLKALYAGRESEDQYVPPEQITEYLAANPKGRPRLYDRICETNAMMARRLGLENVVDMLAEISVEAHARYMRLLLEDDTCVTSPPPS